ncbi:PRELI domain-containing protein 1 [Mactra antiquata]
MKSVTLSHLFQFSWDQVVSGYWQRYPNPKSKHVLTEDVLEREVKGDKLITKRLISKTNPLPQWAWKFIPGQKTSAFVIEESIVDLRTKEFITYTRNIGLQTVSRVDEKCTYSPDPDNKEQSICDRRYSVSSQVYGCSMMITSFVSTRMKKNSYNAVKGMEYVLRKLYIGEDEEQVVAKESMTKRAKDFAKSKAETVKSKAENVKSKVHLPAKTSCETPIGVQDSS